MSANLAERWSMTRANFSKAIMYWRASWLQSRVVNMVNGECTSRSLEIDLLVLYLQLGCSAGTHSSSSPSL